MIRTPIPWFVTPSEKHCGYPMLGSRGTVLKETLKATENLVVTTSGT